MTLDIMENVILADDHCVL